MRGFFVSLTASSTSTPHLKEKFSLHISIFHSLLPHRQRELLVVSLKNLSLPQREVLFAYFNFSLSPTPLSTRSSRCIVEKFVTPLKEKFSLPISIFHSLLPHCQRELLVVSLKNLSPPSKRSSL